MSPPHGVTAVLLLVMMASKEGICGVVLVEFECTTSCTGGTSVGITSNPGACCHGGGGGYRMLSLGDSSDCQPCWDSRLLQPLDLGDEENETESFSGDDDGCSVGGAECHEHATCQRVAGTLKCVCNEGYTGNGLSCVDVDECAEGTDTCDGQYYLTITRHHQVFSRTRGVCVNTVGSFVCSCRKGFVLEGSKCIDIDECLSDDGGRVCAPNAVCHNHVGSYHCHCLKGYVGDGKQCCVSWYELWQYMDRERSHVSQDGTSRGSRSKGRGRRTSKERPAHSPRKTKSRSASKSSRSKRSGDTSSRSSRNRTKLQLTKGCEQYLSRHFDFSKE